MSAGPSAAPGRHEHGFTNAVVRTFLHSNLSVILILLAAAVGLGSLLTTPREEEPQIVVPLADVLVSYPGHSAHEVEQQIAAPLERVLFQIDGVEHVYSTSRRDGAVVTVRFHVGEDRERSLVKLYKRLDEHLDIVPAGVAGWVVKPVEIDDVPVVTLTLTRAGGDGHVLRRVAEEMRERLSGLPDVSRADIVGGSPRVVQVLLDTERMRAHGVDPLRVRRALQVTNTERTAGDLVRADAVVAVGGGRAFGSAAELETVVVGVSGARTVTLSDVAEVVDGPDEIASYVRHGWGPARAHVPAGDAPGAVLGRPPSGVPGGDDATPSAAVTLALAKKKGTNAVLVAEAILERAVELQAVLVPDDVDVVVTRNFGRNADHRVNELVEALLVAVLIVIALLTYGLGWRESLIVAVAVPVVFGLTLAVNQAFGYTINRVTLFALILSLGLLVDDPIVDVENIARHFALRGRATREIVLEAVAEIRPPLVTATLAVIVSFLPMMSITGMMGPYMQPMALNVPIAMAMSMIVAFTITPWLAFHVLRRRYAGDGPPPGESAHAEDSPEVLRRSLVYRVFKPLLAPLLRSRAAAGMFLLAMAAVTGGAVALAATRHVPLKMLPYDNKDELHLVIDAPEGTTLERTDALVREIEAHVAAIPEAVDFVSYVGLASPMDFNGLVRHYYMRAGPHLAELRVNLVGKKSRAAQSHEISGRVREMLAPIVERHGAVLKVVEPPPGPPVVATVVAEVRGPADMSYAELLAAAATVRARLAREPGVVDVDDIREEPRDRLQLVTDHEKAALHGIAVADVAETLGIAVHGGRAGALRAPTERQPLEVLVRLPLPRRSSTALLGALHVAGPGGELVALSELGRFERSVEDQAIYRKDLERVAYVFAETVGRPPAEVVLDVQADRQPDGTNRVADAAPRPVEERTYLDNGGGIEWSVPPGVDVVFDGEGEWQITLDVFRDLGIAFGVALLGIYVLLVAQTGSFLVPLVVMLAIPLTAPGILPGFWALNAMGEAGAGPVYFTATGMIGMIALAGIVTRDAVILVDFVDLSIERGRSLFDAILESRVVRLRPILLTAGTALLSAAPITIDPVFSGLAWALIFGLVASTAFTLFVVPLAYWLIRAGPEDLAAARSA